MKNAISIDLEDWFCVHNLSGVIKLRQGKTDDAQKDFQKALELDPALKEKLGPLMNGEAPPTKQR